MNGHDEYLELLAASIDFGLTEEEVARLNYHLASCPECRRAATELRGQNAVIATTRIVPLAPARSEQILRAALRKPATRPRWGMLAVAALLATLAGGVALAGLRLVDTDPTPSEPPPSQVAEASAPSSESPVDESADPGGQPTDNGPRVTPNPGDEGPPPAPAKLAFPIEYTEQVWGIQVAPAPQDQLWVSVGRDGGTVLSLLDGEGVPRTGWPISVPFAFDCRPLAVEDGSVRLLCAYSEENPETCELGCSEDRIFAWNSSAKVLEGFPLSLEGSESELDRRNARMIGDRLLLTDRIFSDEEGEFPIQYWLVEVGADGAVSSGAHVESWGTCCVISPNGVAYATADDTSEEDVTRTTSVVAFDQTGMQPAWPVVLQGRTSMPAFGPDGELVFAAAYETDSQIFRLREDGTEAAPPTQPFERVMEGDELSGPTQPLVDEDGNAFPTTEEKVYALDRAGAVLPGWPFVPEPALLQYADCPPGDTGCGFQFTPPLMAPAGLVYLVHPPGEGVSGGRITVVNPDGTVRSGWPKTLQRAGAWWDSVAIGKNRRAYAVAIEPESGDKLSASIIAFAPNGTREWITTLVEP